MHRPSQHPRSQWRAAQLARWQNGGGGGWQEDFYHRQVARSGPSPRARLVIPVVVSLILQVPAAVLYPMYTGIFTAVTAITIVLAILGPLVLFAARRYPGPVVAVVAALAGIDFVIAPQNQGPPYVALAFALVGAIVRGARGWAWISVGAGWTATLLVGILSGIDWHPGRVAITTLGILLTMGVGEAMRTRREHLAEYRRAYAQRKQTEVQAERVRIARELHDVLAHSLSQINVQASVGLHLMHKQPEKAAEALASIKETSKTALDEVRSVLGVLRSEGGQDASAPLVPEPDLSRLPGLAASVTSQGVEVVLSNQITDAPKAVQLAIYRIVQESLTNAVRHSGARRAEVRLTQLDHNYLLTVADDGAGLGEHAGEGGRGMLGMRERAELLGGTLDTGTSPLGGLLITASIPMKVTVQ